MMLLLFRINDDCYGLNVADVVELVPFVTLQKLPKAPEYIAGLMNYRGSIVPVVDLAMLTRDRPTRHMMSSRIILIQPVKSEKRFVGLLAENVTEAKRVSEEIFTETGINANTNAFVDRVAMHSTGMIQLVNIAKLLPIEVRVMLQERTRDAAAIKGN